VRYYRAWKRFLAAPPRRQKLINKTGGRRDRTYAPESKNLRWKSPVFPAPIAHSGPFSIKAPTGYCALELFF